MSLSSLILMYMVVSAVTAKVFRNPPTVCKIIANMPSDQKCEDLPDGFDTEEKLWPGVKLSPTDSYGSRACCYICEWEDNRRVCDMTPKATKLSD